MNLQKPVRTIAPVGPVATLAEAKKALRIDDEDTIENGFIESLVAAATSYLEGDEGILGRCLISQTWVVKADCFPLDGEILLPFPDVSSVTVTYFDETNQSQTLSAGLYHLVETDSGSAVQLASAAAWPATYGRPDAVTITLAVGYGAAADVPPAIKTAVLMMAGHLYENREDVVVGVSAVVVPNGAQMLLAPFRRIGF